MRGMLRDEWPTQTSLFMLSARDTECQPATNWHTGKLTALSITLQTLDAFGGIARPLLAAATGGCSGNDLGSHRVLLVTTGDDRHILCRCDRGSGGGGTIGGDTAAGTGSPGRNCSSVHGCVHPWRNK